MGFRRRVAAVRLPDLVHHGRQSLVEQMPPGVFADTEVVVLAEPGHLIHTGLGEAHEGVVDSDAGLVDQQNLWAALTGQRGRLRR